jgi:hypothetical protein
MPEELPGDPVVLLQRHGVEPAHLAHHLEGRLQLPERLDRRTRADELVVVKDDVLVDVEHGDHRLYEATFRLRRRRALLRAGRVGVDVLAAEVLDRRDQVGTHALRHERGVVVRLGVERPGAAVRAHGHARHRLDAAGEDEVLPARGDLLRRDVHGLEAGGAEAVELHAGDGVGQPGLDRGGLGDVHALIADRRDHAEHDVVDPAGVQVGMAGERLVHQSNHQIDRLGGVQRSVHLPPAARGADRVEYQRFG